MWEMAKGISRREGLPVLWRGTSASLLIAVPMVGIYMPLYDTLLHAWSGSMGALAPVVSGTAARASACFCVAPFELLRTRLQASAVAGVSIRSTLSGIVTEHTTAAAAAVQPGSGSGSSWPLHAQQQQSPARAVSVLRAVPRMWTGFSATLVRDVPFSALYWALVEPLRQAMLPLNSHWKPLEKLAASQHARQQARAARSGRTYVPASQQHLHHTQLEILIANMISGCVAGGLAAGLTTPFDVVKTRMQIASPQQAAQLSGSSSGGGIGGIRVFAILREVYVREGLLDGLFKGLKPRAARAAPACGIVVSFYELLKSCLSQREDW
jgi:solute carrier family 25 protein 39/40